jgi:integrin alpha FG-GAP repeat containing protein 1
MDVITLASDQHTLSFYLWSHGEWTKSVRASPLFTIYIDEFSFRRSASFRHPQRVYNVVPGDFTHDGRLDVLVMAQGTSNAQLSLSIYTSMPSGGFCKLLLLRVTPLLKICLDMNPIQLPPSTLAQPIPFDSDGQMRIDLLGLQPESPQLKMWKNVWNATDPLGPLYEV